MLPPWPAVPHWGATRSGAHWCLRPQQQCWQVSQSGCREWTVPWRRWREAPSPARRCSGRRRLICRQRPPLRRRLPATAPRFSCVIASSMHLRNGVWTQCSESPRSDMSVSCVSRDGRCPFLSTDNSNFVAPLRNRNHAIFRGGRQRRSCRRASSRRTPWTLREPVHFRWRRRFANAGNDCRLVVPGWQERRKERAG